MTTGVVSRYVFRDNIKETVHVRAHAAVCAVCLVSLPRLWYGPVRHSNVSDRPSSDVLVVVRFTRVIFGIIINRWFWPVAADTAMDYYKMCQRFGLNSVPSPDGRFTIDELIGEGTYGEVFRARDTLTGNDNIAFGPFRGSRVSGYGQL